MEGDKSERTGVQEKKREEIKSSFLK